MANSIEGEQLSRDEAVGEAYFADPLVHTKTTAMLGAAFLALLPHALSSTQGNDFHRLGMTVLLCWDSR